MGNRSSHGTTSKKINLLRVLVEELHPIKQFSAQFYWNFIPKLHLNRYKLLSCLTETQELSIIPPELINIICEYCCPLYISVGWIFNSFSSEYIPLSYKLGFVLDANNNNYSNTIRPIHNILEENYLILNDRHEENVFRLDIEFYPPEKEKIILELVYKKVADQRKQDKTWIPQPPRSLKQITHNLLAVNICHTILLFNIEKPNREHIKIPTHHHHIINSNQAKEFIVQREPLGH